jgi:hypothetical protein
MIQRAAARGPAFEGKTLRDRSVVWQRPMRQRHAARPAFLVTIHQGHGYPWSGERA